MKQHSTDAAKQTLGEALGASFWFFCTGPAIGLFLMAAQARKVGLGMLIFMPVAYGLTAVAAVIAGTLYSYPFYLVWRHSSNPWVHMIAGALLGAAAGYAGMMIYYYLLSAGDITLWPQSRGLHQYYSLGAAAGAVCGFTFPLAHKLLEKRTLPKPTDAAASPSKTTGLSP